jgi:hypothetical protein
VTAAASTAAAATASTAAAVTTAAGKRGRHGKRGQTKHYDADAQRAPDIVFHFLLTPHRIAPPYFFAPKLVRIGQRRIAEGCSSAGLQRIQT